MRHYRSVGRAIRRGHLHLNPPSNNTVAGSPVIIGYPSFGRYSGELKYDSLAYINAIKLMDKEIHRTMTYPGGRKEARREAVIDRKLARKNG